MIEFIIPNWGDVLELIGIITLIAIALVLILGPPRPI